MAQTVGPLLHAGPHLKNTLRDGSSGASTDLKRNPRNDGISENGLSKKIGIQVAEGFEGCERRRTKNRPLTGKNDIYQPEEIALRSLHWQLREASVPSGFLFAQSGDKRYDGVPAILHRRYNLPKKDFPGLCSTKLTASTFWPHGCSYIAAGEPQKCYRKSLLH